MNEIQLAKKINEQRPKIKIRIEKGEAAATEFELTDSFYIGRSENCQVKILDETISRFHVEVYFKENHWWIKDLQSANGTYIGGNKIQEAHLLKSTKIELGKGGPQVLLEIEEESHEPATSLREKHSVTQYIKRYFTASEDGNIGEHTRMIRQTFQLIQKKQQKKYVKVIFVLVCLFIFAGAYAIFKHNQLQKQKVLAEGIFYDMKMLEVRMAKLAAMIPKDEQERQNKEIEQMMEKYNKLVNSLDIYSKKLTEEERLILKIVRIFGECEINIPPDFAKEVKNYIKKWQFTPRYKKAITRAIEQGYVSKIVEEMINQGLPPHYFYLALQESDFEVKKCGPETNFGIAKGMWQFIPATAKDYNLKIGLLSESPYYDRDDERHNFEKSTRAAAKYIKDLYANLTQASGLLVMASYNWGEGKVRKLIRELPDNPRERNFWKLLEKYRDQIPSQTYDYVFYIISAAVIGEEPHLFHFDFNNPLAEIEK